jgi:hypothetical protein
VSPSERAIASVLESGSVERASLSCDWDIWATEIRAEDSRYFQ